MGKYTENRNFAKKEKQRKKTEKGKEHSKYGSEIESSRKTLLMERIPTTAIKNARGTGQRVAGKKVFSNKVLCTRQPASPRKQR